MTEPVLEIRDLRTYFHTIRGVYRAVDGVDLTVRAGRTLCVVGESGSGKSATALSVMGLIDAPGEIQPGSRIRFDGQELVGLSDREHRRIRGRDLSMIFQEPMTSLDPVYPVGHQIVEAIRAHQPVSRKAALDRAVELMTLVGIPSPDRRLWDYPHHLSGGMRQRVMIAIALSSHPKLLVADEPTTALDVTIQAQILELMRDLQKKMGMAIMMITHDLGVVAEMADDVAVMYAGQIVESGTAEEVLTNPRHPYTEALLHAVPVLGMSRDEPLRVIPGVVPSPLEWPAGCRFAARCGYAHERCAEPPPTANVGRHQTRCWLSVDRSPGTGSATRTAAAGEVNR
ncbi:ABC transporter ATP-binding protein [Micromonospora sp. NPDC047740]|uniref:ABC transporter ATP-binding protein n=1 Tax=Micromonospora sp. NPDC047740 TaxID=3364254 RepID=UPI00371F71BF